LGRRTTIILDEDVYEMLVNESIKRYGTSKAISRVINDIVRKSIGYRRYLRELVLSEPQAFVDEEEFGKFRRELGKRIMKR